MRYSEFDEIDLTLYDGKSFDTEKFSTFLYDLSQDIDRYSAEARSLEAGYAKYYNNETFRGEAADESKKFIENGQMDKLHVINHNIQKDLFKACLDIKEVFEWVVDSSPKARIDTNVLKQIKEDHKKRSEIIDNIGCEIECKTREVANEFSDLQGFDYVSFDSVRDIYNEFCGDGGFVDKCIKKVETFDEQAKSIIHQSGIKDRTNQLHIAIRNTMVGLDSIQVKPQNVAKKSVSLITFKNNMTNPWANLYSNTFNKTVPPITFPKIQTMKGNTTGFFIVVDDAKRTRIGKVSENFVTVTGTGMTDEKGKSIDGFGGSQNWIVNDPEMGNLIYKYGCGIIASINQSLYLTGQTKINKEDYKKLVHEYLEGKDQIEPRQERYAEVRKQAIRGPIEGALPGQMTDYVTTICGQNGVSISTKWDYTDGYETDYQNMKKQLEKGIPVIWSHYDDDGEKVRYYTYDSSVGGYVCDRNNPQGASSHYVTATAIYEDVDDNGHRRRMVEISSWGKKYYVDYDQYKEVVSDKDINQPFSSITNTSIK